MPEAATSGALTDIEAPPGAGDAVEVVIEVPRILCDCTGGQREVTVQADTIESALRKVRTKWPMLATHVFEESGAVRQHVLVLHNGKLTRWMKSLDVPMRAGDRLQILQAVSGG